MRYYNARDIFPENVLLMMQQYADGEYVYIPRKRGSRKPWSEKAKNETTRRNNNIYARYKTGLKVKELAEEYFLSEKSIERIITIGKKSERGF